MNNKKKRTFFTELFWRILFVLILLSAGITGYFWFRSPDTSLSYSQETVEQNKIERANALTKTIENQIVQHLTNPLETFVPQLPSNTDDIKILLQTWLKDHPDILAITLWQENEEWPTRVLKENFWDLAPVRKIKSEERQSLFSFIFQNTYDHMTTLHFGDLLPSTYFGNTVIPITKLLNHSPFSAIRIHVLVKDFSQNITLSLDSLESLIVLDQHDNMMLSFEKSIITGSDSESGQKIQWMPQSISIPRSFQNLPWKTVYSVIIPDTKTIDSPSRQISYYYLGIIFASCILVSIILSQLFSRPVRQMSQKATLISQGAFHEVVDHQVNSDLDQIASVLNYMAHEMERMQEMNVGEIISEKIKTETILRNIADGVIVTDDENHVLIINRVAETWFGFSEKEMLNKKLEQFIHIETLSSLIDNVKNRKSKLTAEFPYIPFNANEAKVFQAHSSSVFNKNGALIGVVTAIRDVTREREVDRIKTELVSMVAHELKSPLTSIFGFSELLLESDMKDPQLIEYAHIIMTESSRLTDLVNKFLDLTRLESGRTEIKMNPFELVSVVEKMMDSHKQQTDKKAIKVILEIPDDLPLVMGDQDMIEQVLLNLLSNAVKYSPKRSKVGIEAKEDNGKVLVSVIDNGYGIPKESLQHIFDKFYRVADSTNDNEIEGSGLGLTLAKEIIQHHGGEIKVQSRLGVGSVFSFTLPKADR